VVNPRTRSPALQMPCGSRNHHCQDLNEPKCATRQLLDLHFSRQNLQSFEFSPHTDTRADCFALSARELWAYPLPTINTFKPRSARVFGVSWVLQVKRHSQINSQFGPDAVHTHPMVCTPKHRPGRGAVCTFTEF